MRADDLDHAIELQNAGDYALTGGIHSLDDAEVEHWLADVEIGNAYVNRHITGAIVQRQPFGGWKRSSVGGGAKAGGPGYVAQFARITDPRIGADRSAVVDARRCGRPGSGTTAPITTRPVSSQRPTSCATSRSTASRSATPTTPIDGSPFCAWSPRSPVCRSGSPAPPTRPTPSSPIDWHTARCAPTGSACSPTSTTTRCTILHAADIAIDVVEPVADPMIELQRWVREQAISRTLHRHGRLVD